MFPSKSSVSVQFLHQNKEQPSGGRWGKKKVHLEQIVVDRDGIWGRSLLALKEELDTESDFGQSSSR